MRKGILLALLLLLLPACRVVITDAETEVGVRFGYRAGGVIQRFEPDRGPGAVYRVGEAVRFFVDLARPGYVTLVITDPDGRRYALEEARWLPAGWSELPPRWAGYRYTAEPPTGRHRATLYYGERRGAVAFSLVLRSGRAATAGIRVDERVRTDRAETYLWILP